MTDFFKDTYYGPCFPNGYFGPETEQNPGAMSAGLSGAGEVGAVLSVAVSTADADSGGGAKRKKRGSSARPFHSYELKQHQYWLEEQTRTAAVIAAPKPEPLANNDNDDEEVLMLLLSA